MKKFFYLVSMFIAVFAAFSCSNMDDAESISNINDLKKDFNSDLLAFANNQKGLFVELKEKAISLEKSDLADVQTRSSELDDSLSQIIMAFEENVRTLVQNYPEFFSNPDTTNIPNLTEEERVMLTHDVNLLMDFIQDHYSEEASTIFREYLINDNKEVLKAPNVVANDGLTPKEKLDLLIVSSAAEAANEFEIERPINDLQQFNGDLEAVLQTEEDYLSKKNEGDLVCFTLFAGNLIANLAATPVTSPIVSGFVCLLDYVSYINCKELVRRDYDECMKRTIRK